MKRITIKVVVGLVMLSLLALPLAGACAPEELEEFTLMITVIGEGTTSPAPGTSTVTEGESVTVTAIPNTGYELDYWEGDVSGTDDSVTFKMTSDKSVVAVFVEGVPEFQWPDKLALISATGVGLASTTGYAAAMAADTGMTIRVVPEVSPVLRFKWTKEGRFFCCVEATSVVVRVLGAEGEWAARDAGPFQLRIIWAHSVADAGFIVRGDSDIETIYDIGPGTRFVDMVFYPGYRESHAGALLAWAGVDPDDIEWVPGSTYAACIRSISDGRADVSLCFPMSPDVMEAAAAPHGIRFLDLPYDEDPEGANRYIEVEPTTTFGVMSQSPEAMGVRGIVGINPLMCSADEDPELVYHFAKWLDENYDLYKDSHAWNAYMTIDNLMRILETWFIPAHEGLIQYLEEKGLWTAAHDARQAQNVELVTMYCEAYEEAIDMADAQGIEVDPENEEWLTLWDDYKEELGLPTIRTYVGLEE